MSQAEKVRALRHTVISATNLSVVVEWQSGGESHTTPARLIDISPGGTKLSLAHSIKFHDAVRLTMSNSTGELNISVSASQCWARHDNRGGWMGGFAFAPPLPRELVEKLFADGLLERRQTSRVATDIPCRVQWETSPERQASVLLDVSSGGFCVRAERAMETGTRLLLILEKPDEPPSAVPAKAQWIFATDLGPVIGCSFVTSNGYPSVADFALPDRDLERSGGRRRTRLPVLAIAAVLALYMLYCVMFL